MRGVPEEVSIAHTKMAHSRARENKMAFIGDFWQGTMRTAAAGPGDPGPGTTAGIVGKVVTPHTDTQEHADGTCP